MSNLKIFILKQLRNIFKSCVMSRGSLYKAVGVEFNLYYIQKNLNSFIIYIEIIVSYELKASPKHLNSFERRL